MEDQKKSDQELEKISKSLSMLRHHPHCECDQCISEKEFVEKVSLYSDSPLNKIP